MHYTIRIENKVSRLVLAFLGRNGRTYTTPKVIPTLADARRLRATFESPWNAWPETIVTILRHRTDAVR